MALWWSEIGTRVLFSDLRASPTFQLSSSGGGLPGRAGFGRIRAPVLISRQSACGADTPVRGRCFCFCLLFLLLIQRIPPFHVSCILPSACADRSVRATRAIGPHEKASLWRWGSSPGSELAFARLGR